MKHAELDDLARSHGINLSRPSPDNEEVPISNETKRKVLAALNVELQLLADLPKASRTLSTTGPARKPIPKSYLPNFLATGRVWGVSLQLYDPIRPQLGDRRFCGPVNDG